LNGIIIGNRYLNYIVMKKNSAYLFMVVLLFAGFLTSCKKNDPSSLGFKMKAVDTGVNNLKDSDGSATGLAVLPLSWDTAWIYVSKVEFEAEFDEHSDSLGGNGSFEVKFEWKGNQLINLLGEPQVFATLDLPDGLYDEIELKVKSEEQGITGNPNFYLSGLYGSGVGDLRVVLLVSEDFEIGNEFEDWVINTENVSFYDGLLEISLQQLFNGISSSDLENSEISNGRILISETSNRDIYEKVFENLKTNMDCDHDGDHD
jgi:hypothetical protein